MSTTINCNDITMKDCAFNSFYPRFNIRKCPRKRTYLEMLKDSEESTINSRIDNFNLLNKNINYFEKKLSESNNSYDIFRKNNNIFGISDSNNAKKNFMIKRKLEYDEEKEKKFVENYYKIKNAELIKLRFGTDQKQNIKNILVDIYLLGNNYNYKNSNI